MSRLASYIDNNALTPGHVLGTSEQVARLLDCTTDAVAEQIDACEAMGMVSLDEEGRIIVQSPLIYHAEMSFTHSALALKQDIQTIVLPDIDGARLPRKGNEPLERLEKLAQRSLGLKESDCFIVIPRVRVINGKRRAIHRVYLDPKRFPDNFLALHDFSTESMIHIYAEEGYELLSRDTTLRARLPFTGEKIDLELHKKVEAIVPILDARQILWAKDPKGGDRFPLEFLQATYLHWEYSVTNRPPPKAG